jgi:hypothetical protein
LQKKIWLQRYLFFEAYLQGPKSGHEFYERFQPPFNLILVIVAIVVVFLAFKNLFEHLGDPDLTQERLGCSMISRFCQPFDFDYCLICSKHSVVEMAPFF